MNTLNTPFHPSRRSPLALFLALLAGASILLPGCGSKNPDAETLSPKQAATQLDQAFAGPEESTTDEIRIGVRTAAEALREGNYEKAVVALQVTKTTTNMSFDQGMAVHNSMVALEHNLINAAAAGDAKAQRAYELLKKSKRN